MKRSMHIVVQVVLVLGQYLPHIWPIIPQGGQEAWHGMISALQGVLAAAAHGWNRDGSPSLQ